MRLVNVRKPFGGECTFLCVWETRTMYWGIAIVSVTKNGNPCIPICSFSCGRCCAIAPCPSSLPLCTHFFEAQRTDR